MIMDWRWKSVDNINQILLIRFQKYTQKLYHLHFLQPGLVLFSCKSFYDMIGEMQLFCNLHNHFIPCQSRVTCNMQFRFDVKHMVVIIDKIRQMTPGVLKAMPSVAQGHKMISY